MSFRRYAPPKATPTSHNPGIPAEKTEPLPSGIKPGVTPLISTGTLTLDALLSPAGGLPVSSSLLIEEDGTGNYSGVILRQYAAEGVVQGNRVWVGGIGQAWWRGVPGLSKEEKAKASDAVKQVEEKMKIAWRYGVNDPKSVDMERDTFTGFCHSFEISEQMTFPGQDAVVFSPPPAPSGNPFTPLLQSLSTFLDRVPKTAPVRLVLPDLLNPLLYSPESTNPSALLQFLHTVTALIHEHKYATLIISLSTSFFPRSNPLVSWVEHLCAYVLQLCPLPRPPLSSTIKHPQGLVHVHKGGLMSSEMAYRVGRRGMVLEEWSLPPLEDETPRVKQGFVIGKEVGKVAVGASPISGVSKKDLEF
jgi:elongator complex protein 4